MVHATGQTLVAADGRRVRLGRLLGQGGEGAVFDVEGESATVAKLYAKPPSKIHAEKLAVMARSVTPALLGVAAWPTATLHATSGAPVCGLLMPRVSDGKEIHRLYSPAHRKLDFTSADWAFLLRAARNAAAAVNTVHDHGHVIGDVNQGNIMVTAQGLTRFIDCDSFQIHNGGRVYHCEVGVAHFTPPELQGGSFTGIVRTQNHDCFGLAVLCFHLLFLGRHPFAGRFAGRGDMPIERAIKEHRFAFGRSAHRLQMSPPPHALPIVAASTKVADLFERAFSPDGPKTNGRPSAFEWVTALDAVEAQLAACKVSAGHRYYRDLPTCPWCQIRKQGGPDFFIVLSAASRIEAAVAVDLSSLWSQFVGLRLPSALVQSPTLAATCNATGRPLPAELQSLVSRASRAGWIASILLLACGVLPGPLLMWATVAAAATVGWVRKKISVNNVTADYRKVLADAAQEFQQQKENWLEKVTNPWLKLDAGVAGIQRRAQEYEDLRQQHQRDLDRIKINARESQLKVHLQTAFLDKAQIKGIGRSLKATLASYGVETAADIKESRITSIPGFRPRRKRRGAAAGPTRFEMLQAWRRSVEASFKFDPSKGVTDADRIVLAQRYGHRFSSIKSEAEARLPELRTLKESVTKSQEALRQDYLATLAKYEQARADVAMLAPHGKPQVGLAATGAFLMAFRVMGLPTIGVPTAGDVAVPLSAGAIRRTEAQPGAGARLTPTATPATATVATHTSLPASPSPQIPSVESRSAEATAPTKKSSQPEGAGSGNSGS